MNYINTIIIGGGISGMACGRTLHDSGEDFLLFTKDIGGRMLVSNSRKVNYGASYITADYKNAIPYMGGGERLRIRDSYFLINNKFITIWNWRNIFQLPKLIKLYWALRDFRLRLSRLRKESLYISQKEALESDHILKKYTEQSTKDFIKENRLEYLNETFFGPLFNSTAFIEYDKSNTFAYLNTLLVMISNTYMANHVQCCSLLMAGWENKVKEIEVKFLIKDSRGDYIVKTSDDSYRAKNIALSLPYKDAKKLWDVPSPKYNIPIYVIHVAGERKKIYKKMKIVFLRPESHEITILWKQVSGDDIIFSKVENPELERYYSTHRIIKINYWETATVLSGGEWVDQVLDKGLYLASDYNICGLEDAFITGAYAANNIIKFKKQ